MSATQRKESSTSDSFPVAQFDSSQKPYVAFGNVSIAVSHCNMGQSFACNISYRLQTLATHAMLHPLRGSCVTRVGVEPILDCRITTYDNQVMILLDFERFKTTMTVTVCGSMP